MENNMYSAPLNITCPNSTVIEEIRQHLAPKPLIHCYSFDLNNQNHIINGITVLAGEQGETTSYVHADGCFMSPPSVADSNSFVTSQGKTIVGDTSNPINNNDFQEHVAGGMPIASASLSARIGHKENLENLAALPPSICSLEALGPYIFNNWQDTSNPLSATFGDHAYDGLPGIGTWHLSKFLKAPDADGTEIMAYSSIANLVQNGWTSSNVANLAHFAYNSSNCSNELSLSLAKSPTTGQCSEMSCSDASHNMNGPINSGLEQPSCSSKELSMRLFSNKHGQFSPTILGSRYHAGIQEILAQIATYSLGNIEQINYSAAGVGARGNSSASDFTPKRRVDINQNANSMFEAHVESPLQRQATDSNKSQLLMLLQLVDNGYNKCLDEIHTVMSAFHAATELDPHMHAHFALQMISFLHKDLRERISNCILAMESDFNRLCSEEKEWSIETSFIQKQWALQQLKRKDQLWRPQRGLPERSVSVLRAWLFQNFLHPYPKDVEKHLLAVRSGLTRSQVSNWFINARVRLWKPMIEEMYAEMRSKACRNDGGMEITQRSRISMHEQSNVEYQLKQKKVT